MLMTKAEILELYMRQSENVRELNRVKAILIKDINHHIRKSEAFQLEIKTKLLALLYTAWSEAQFVQIVYTPSGFTSSEIENIKTTKNSTGVSDGWKQMIELALRKVGEWKKSADLQNRRQELFRIVDEYIKEPSLLRNKIAHGQWLNALNRENTAINSQITTDLAALDVVEITRWFEVHRFLGFIVRDLVQSPRIGFHKNYWVNLTALENLLEKTKDWTIESKREKLQLKPIKTE